MRTHIEIAGRRIGPGEPVYIVAEVGTTANGDVDTARRLADAAKEAGADAVKFQMIGADYFMSDRSVTYEYETADGRRSENMYQMFKKLEFSPAQWGAIDAHCREIGLTWYSTIDFLPGVDLGEQLAMPAYKLSSWDTANLPLARKMARAGKPIVIDTGPTYLVDLVKLVDAIRAEGNDQILLLHCTHSKTSDGVHLRAIPYLRDSLTALVGYSADERTITPDIAAIALGASMIEKRMTLNTRFRAHHHVKALEPDEFKVAVKELREAETLLGQPVVLPSPEDLRQREIYYVSIVADQDIPAGAVITEDMLACKRPGSGLMPEQMPLVVGRVAKRHIKLNDLISWADV